jgi:hypothetical protein
VLAHPDGVRRFIEDLVLLSHHRRRAMSRLRSTRLVVTRGRDGWSCERPLIRLPTQPTLRRRLLRHLRWGMLGCPPGDGAQPLFAFDSELPVSWNF